MNAIINDLLEELVEYKKTLQPSNFLKNAIQKQEFAILSTIIGELLTWQKHILLGFDYDDDFQSDKLLIDEVSQNQYNNLFDNCPELSEIFSLGKGEIRYNESLTEEDKDNIRKYIHDNFKVKTRITMRRRKK